MKVMIGSPGTVSGLLLRVGQCVFAAASIGVMVCADGFSSYTAFWQMKVGIITSLVFLQVTAMLSLAAACSSAGVVVLYARDLNFCKTQENLPCRRFEISILLALGTWLIIAISSHVMFWTLASI
ncbi:CASP-like protein 5B2 [Linum perenne]